MIKKILFVLTVYFFAVSCTNNNYNDKIKTIDSLNTKVDTLTKQIIGYNNIIFLDRYNLMFGKIKIFGKFITNKNLNSNMAREFNKYATLSKFYKHAAEEKDNLFNELALSKQQLQNLKHDLQKNVINADSADSYFNIEKKIADKLFIKTNLFFSEIKENDNTFKNLSTKIDFLIDSLENTIKK